MGPKPLPHNSPPWTPAGRPRLRWVAIVAVVLWLAAAQAQQLERVAAGLRQPVAITHAGDGSGRLFIAEQGGLIRIIVGERLLDSPFLDLRDLTKAAGERGLLGLTFHPDYPRSGFFYVHYSDLAGNTVIARYQVSDDPNRAEPASAVTILRVDQPFPNHNGGQLAFGPDGYLYLGLGDGGAAGDPLGAGQDLSTLLGKLLRLDVDGATPYAIPADNPFRNTPGARAEIWAYGLRNPWRFSFDRVSGDLYIGDVGQNAFEEIDWQPAASSGGENYGWNIMEGRSCFLAGNRCDATGLTLPVIVYPQGSGTGRSVTGGFVYRGEAAPDLNGSYLFADFASGRIWAATMPANPTAAPWKFSELLHPGFTISTFGEDEAGELYLADYGGGVIYRLRP